MRAAGGMQNKLIEYLASGVPVVASSVANEGIQAPAGKALIIENAADGFVNSISDLLSNPEKAASLALFGRQFVLDRWTWEAHFFELENNFYKSVDSSTEQWSIDLNA